MKCCGNKWIAFYSVKWLNANWMRIQFTLSAMRFESTLNAHQVWKGLNTFPSLMSLDSVTAVLLITIKPVYSTNFSIQFSNPVNWDHYHLVNLPRSIKYFSPSLLLTLRFILPCLLWTRPNLKVMTKVVLGYSSLVPWHYIFLSIICSTWLYNMVHFH